MRFIISDGKIIDKGDYTVPEIHFGTRINLSQKIWYGYGGIPLFSENMALIKAEAEALQIPYPREFENKRELFRLIKRMLNKNRFYRSGHLLLQIFIREESIHTLVSSITFSGFTFPFSEEGVLVAISMQKKLTSNSMNGLSFFNERIWLLALSEIRNTEYKQTVILNEKNSVCEGAFSSLFIISGNELTTPSLQAGCHDNALRSLVLDAAERLGLKINQALHVSKDQIFDADEIFYASEDWGIQWVLGIERQRFIHYYSAKIAEELNVLLKAKATVNRL